MLHGRVQSFLKMSLASDGAGGSNSSSSSTEAEAAALVAVVPVAEGIQVVWHYMQCAQGSASPSLVNAAQLERAYWAFRLTHGQKPSRLRPAQTLAAMYSAVAQEQLHARSAALKRKGRDFSLAHTYYPAGKAAKVIDEPHKLKTAAKEQEQGSIYPEGAPLAAMQDIASLRPCGFTGGPRQGPARGGNPGPRPPARGGQLSMDSQVLVAVLQHLVQEWQDTAAADQMEKFMGEDPKVLLAIAQGRTDTQSVACAQALLGSRLLATTLRDMGFLR